MLLLSSLIVLMMVGRQAGTTRSIISMEKGKEKKIRNQLLESE
jgi:hypothetical protein